MERAFKHPQIFADLLSLLQAYYPIHNRMPKGFRFSVGEQILQELGQCMRLVVQANGLDKHNATACGQGAAVLLQLRSGIEVVRAYFIAAWKLRFLSHGALAELSARVEGVARQAARWQQWFSARVQTMDSAASPMSNTATNSK